MKTIIAGSRDITDFRIVTKAFNLARDEHFFNITEIVSGTARGVDQLGEDLAQTLGLPLKRFPANWALHGRGAGFVRNEQMARYADALIAIWDGKSRGTKHMIDTATKFGLTIYIHRTDTRS